MMDPKKPTFKCCICRKVKEGYGNTPNPYLFRGRCCDECNRRYVIPLRYMLSIQSRSQGSDDK